jgi:hypothetical protein
MLGTVHVAAVNGVQVASVRRRDAAKETLTIASTAAMRGDTNPDTHDERQAVIEVAEKARVDEGWRSARIVMAPRLTIHLARQAL